MGILRDFQQLIEKEQKQEEEIRLQKERLGQKITKANEAYERAKAVYVEYQNAIRKQIPSYNPEGLEGWLETQDKGLQEEGKSCGKLIEKHVKSRVLRKLEELYGVTWENQIKSIKGRCLMRMDDSEDVDDQDWTDYMNLQDFKEIIDSRWRTQKEDDETFITFEEEFSIQVTEAFRTKTERHKWINDLISFSKSWTTTKGRALTQADVNEMRSILQSFTPTDEI